jgi:sugar lactone lactonase YvrE
MRRATVSLIVVALVCSAASIAAADGPRVHVVASFDASKNQLPEGLAVTRHGTMFVGFAPTGEIMKIDPQGTVSQVATLPNGSGLLTGLALDSDGRLFAALASFDAATEGIWRVGRHGSTTRVAALPPTSFPNGIAFRNKAMYVTDSFGGAVYRIRHGRARVWFQSKLLVGDLSSSFPVGANGIQFRGLYAYVVNDQKGRLVRIPVTPGGGAGGAVVLLHSPAIVGADGIAFDVRGNLYAALNEKNELVRIGPSGGTRVLATRTDGLDFPATPAFGQAPGTRTHLFLTNFAFGTTKNPNPALLVLRVGVRGARLP